MGFELKVQRGSLGESAEIRSVDSAHLATTFINVVKQCVGRKILDITVNVNGVEPLFPEVKESVVKLGQFVASKGQRLKLIGDQLSVTEIEDLKKSGIAIVQSDRGVSASLKTLIKDFEESGALPTDPLLGTEAETQREQLNVLRDRYDKLELELKSFRTHKDVMMKSKISVETAKKEIGKIQSNTDKSKKTLEEITKKKTELTNLAIEADQEEKKLAEFLKKSDQENKKKEDVAKKELESEKNRFQKIEQEFKKKSDMRVAEAKKLEAKARDPKAPPPAAPAPEAAPETKPATDSAAVVDPVVKDPSKKS